MGKGRGYTGTSQLTTTTKLKSLRFLLLEISPIEKTTLDSNDLYIFSILVLK